MKSEFSILVLAIIVLTLGGAAEELLPKPLGVGFPFLFCAAIWFAYRTTHTAAFIFALATGTAEDALSGLPFIMSASYFVLASTVIRLFRLPTLVAPLLYFGYQFWLWLWVSPLQGNLCMRSLLALPIGAGTILIVAALLDCVQREGGLGEK